MFQDAVEDQSTISDNRQFDDDALVLQSKLQARGIR